MFWRFCMVTTVAATLAVRPALAEDPPKPEQLKQMYDDTLAQLKNAQERKTQLAAENEQLKAKLADLQKQLDVAQAKNAELQKQASTYGEGANQGTVGVIGPTRMRYSRAIAVVDGAAQAVSRLLRDPN